MYFETMLQSVTGRPLYSICCIVLSRVVVCFVVVCKKFTLEKDIEKIQRSNMTISLLQFWFCADIRKLREM